MLVKGYFAAFLLLFFLLWQLYLNLFKKLNEVVDLIDLDSARVLAVEHFENRLVLDLIDSELI